MLLLSQIAGYMVSTILSLCVSIPLICNLKDFGGKCLLFSQGEFLENGFFVPQWATSMNCVLTLVLAISLTIISVYQLVIVSIHFRRGTDCSFISAFWDTLIALIFVIFTLLDAISITYGFSRWCSALTQRFPSCEAAASIVTFNGDSSSIDPSWFFVEFGTVQFGIWACFVTWVLLLVLSSRKLFIHHERENLIVSMSRERHRYASRGYNDLNQ
ncbi:transmembrane protein 179 [Brevipalpus obovatus]|uniref:transmembrane protein 179 n=1 Tax=Brevipalpus obovatus TaxID=246614 RepID=UPI003D9E5513